MTTSWHGPARDERRLLRLRQRLGQPEDDLVRRDAERQAEIAAVRADTGDHPKRTALDALEQHRPAVVRQREPRDLEIRVGLRLVAEEIAGGVGCHAEIRVDPFELLEVSRRSQTYLVSVR